MPGFLRFGTTADLKIGPFIDDTDFKTPETAIVFVAGDVLLSKNGGTHAGKNEASAPASVGAGFYSVLLDATDTNTPGVLHLYINKAGALIVWDTFQVIPQHVYDALMTYTDPIKYLPINVYQYKDGIVADPDSTGYPKVTIKDGTGQGELSTASGVVLATDHAGANLATAAAIAALNNLSAAQVKTQVTDALNVDTYAEIGQEAPAATQTLRKMIAYLYKGFRNKITQTATDYKVFADDGTTVDQKATLSDDDTIYTRSKIGSGP